VPVQKRKKKNNSNDKQYHLKKNVVTNQSEAATVIPIRWQQQKNGFFSQTQNSIVTEMYTSICIHDQRNKKEERIVAIKSTRQCLPCCFPLDQAPVFQKEMNWTFLFVSFDL